MTISADKAKLMEYIIMCKSYREETLNNVLVCQMPFMCSKPARNQV